MLIIKNPVIRSTDYRDLEKPKNKLWMMLYLMEPCWCLGMKLPNFAHL